MTPYQLQTRQRGGIVIRQGRSWITLRRDEIESLVGELTVHLDGLRAEETAKVDQVP